MESGLLDIGSVSFCCEVSPFLPISCRHTFGNECSMCWGVIGLVSFEYTTRFIHLFSLSPDPSVHCSISTYIHCHN